MKPLLTILEVQHRDRDGTLLWEQKNLPNIFHLAGDALILGIAFSNTTKPNNYYCGLDNRATLSVMDGLGNLSQEPSQFGYVRQALSSSTGFQVSVNQQQQYQATSSVMTFVGSGGTWGPVQNLFLCTSSDNSGILISSAPLSSNSVFVANGQMLTLRMALVLRDATGATFVT